MLRVFRHYVSAPAIVLLLLEGAVLFAVLWLVMREVWGGVDFGRDGRGSALVPVSLFATLVLCSIGLYDKSALTDYRRAAARLLVAFVICWPVLLLPLFGVTEVDGQAVGRLAVHSAVAMGGALGGVLVARVTWNGVTDAARLQRRILVLGSGRRAAMIENRLGQSPGGAACKVVGYVPVGGEAGRLPEARLVAAGEDRPLHEIARRLGAVEVVVALDDRRGTPLGPLLDARLNGLKVTDFLTFWERETGKVMLDALEPSWLVYSDGFQMGGVVNRALKRLLDIVFGSLFLVFTLPVTLAAAVAVRLDSPGPVFYKQERVGWRGRVFTLYKFRSMRADAETDGTPRWADEDDPRITRVGAFLRKTRIDEIPQVLNVLKGDMSFIGPRPERPFFVAAISRQVPYYAERSRVRPGITGWAQINYPYGASIEDAKEKLAYDLYYIKNYSLMLDIMVLVGTIQVILWPRGVR